MRDPEIKAINFCRRGVIDDFFSLGRTAAVHRVHRQYHFTRLVFKSQRSGNPERVSVRSRCNLRAAKKQLRIALHLEKIRAPLLAINFADDLINPPELGILEREIKRVPHGKALLIPQSDKTRGHGTHTLAAVWKEHLLALLQESGR